MEDMSLAAITHETRGDHATGVLKSAGPGEKKDTSEGARAKQRGESVEHSTNVFQTEYTISPPTRSIIDPKLVGGSEPATAGGHVFIQGHTSTKRRWPRCHFSQLAKNTQTANQGNIIRASSKQEPNKILASWNP